MHGFSNVDRITNYLVRISGAEERLSGRRDASRFFSIEASRLSEVKSASDSTFVFRSQMASAHHSSRRKNASRTSFSSEATNSPLLRNSITATGGNFEAASCLGRAGSHVLAELNAAQDPTLNLIGHLPAIFGGRNPSWSIKPNRPLRESNQSPRRTI